MGYTAASNINKAALKNISRRAGVARFSGLVFEEARGCLVVSLF